MHVLFIAYHPVAHTIMLSQGLPYMKGLAGKGAEYSLLTFETNQSRNLSCQYVADFTPPLKWQYLKYHQKPRMMATLWDIFLGIAATARIIIKDKVKIIHARGFIPALIAFIPAKIFKVKLFFDTRGLLADKYVCGGLVDNGRLTYRVMRAGEDFLLKHSEIFTVETNSHAQVIKNTHSNLASKLRIIPCCVDTVKFDYRLYKNNPGDGLRLVYLGQVGTWYLLDKMLDFFKIMSQELPQAQFTFITESSPGIFYTTAKKMGINENKIMVRGADHKDIPGLLAASSAGIFFMNPYKRYNTFPIKFGEYLASGLPVVLNSGIGDCDEIIGNENAGVIVKDFSTAEYQRAIGALKLLLEEKEAARLRCRLAAEKYCSLAKGIESYADIYKYLEGAGS
jgi:glycosyltransferase involved in cell wall biosynthesis